MRKGFTLIELIVVIAIIAILAAIIAPNAFKAIEKGKIAATIGDLRAIKTSAMSYYADTGTWPPNGTTSTTNPNLFLSDSAAGVSGWDGPYLEKWPAKTAWNGQYIWRNNYLFDGDASIDHYIEITRLNTGNLFPKIDAQIDGEVGSATGTLQVAGEGDSVFYFVAE